MSDESTNPNHPAADRLAQTVTDAMDWRDLPPVRALLRTHECFNDNEGTDVGRPMIDALVTIGWLERIQNSPAKWTITGAGTQVIEAFLRARESAPAQEPVAYGICTDTGGWFNEIAPVKWTVVR